MLLALIDRYLAISHPLYHREKMTVRLACGLVLLSSTLVVFLLKFAYILGIGAQRCEVWLFHTKIVLIILTVVFASCIALNVIVYRRTRNHLSESQCFASLTNDADGHPIQTVETINLGNVTERNECRAPVVQNDGTYPIIRPMSIHVSRQKLCQMEMEAAHTLVVGVTSVIITSLPPTIFVSIFLVCRFVSQSECSHLNWLAPYMIELGLVNIVSSPLIFIVRNKELRTALTCRLNQV
jgi:dopamine receptor D1